MKTNKVKFESLVELSQERSDAGKQTHGSNMCKSNYPADLRLVEIGIGDVGNFFIVVILPKKALVRFRPTKCSECRMTLLVLHVSSKIIVMLN